jgi:hypothetical protein
LADYTLGLVLSEGEEENGLGVGVHLPPAIHSFVVRSLRALPITDTELKLMAAAAIIGLRSKPNAGKSTPAASGTPTTL